MSKKLRIVWAIALFCTGIVVGADNFDEQTDVCCVANHRQSDGGWVCEMGPLDPQKGCVEAGGCHDRWRDSVFDRDGNIIEKTCSPVASVVLEDGGDLSGNDGGFKNRLTVKNPNWVGANLRVQSCDHETLFDGAKTRVHAIDIPIPAEVKCFLIEGDTNNDGKPDFRACNRSQGGEIHLYSDDGAGPEILVGHQTKDGVDVCVVKS